MPEESRKSGKRYGVIAVCGVLALAVLAGAYWMGRSTGGGKDVGTEAAKSAALSHAGIAESALSHYEIARDDRDGVPVYEVQFTADGVAYDYEVSAADGSIVKFSRDAEETAPPPSDIPAPAPEEGDIGQARAWEIALDHAGVTAEETSPVKRDYDDGVLVYELEFFSGGYEYDYEIRADDGTVVKFEKEADLRSAPPQTSPGSAPEKTPPASGSTGDIGEARAKEIALAHAGVTADSVTGYRWELDYDDGVPVYELEFFSGGCEYDYKIKAADGSIVKSKKEAQASPASGSTGNTGDIGEARAKEIALAHAGVTADSVTGYRWELDYDDGVPVYELEFFSGGYEYDYEIKAADGSIVKSKKEADGIQPPQNAAGSADPSYIGEARAKEIAYSHAGLAAADVAYCSVELDHHDGHHGNHHGSGCCEYELDFKCGGYEYEYKVDAVTGAILESGRELDD